MQGNPDHQTGFNLVLCYYALEDGLSMKKAFQRLAAIPVQVIAVSLSKRSNYKYYKYNACSVCLLETQTMHFGRCRL